MLGPSEWAGMRLHFTPALKAEHENVPIKTADVEACLIPTRASQGDVNFTPTSLDSILRQDKSKQIPGPGNQELVNMRAYSWCMACHNKWPWLEAYEDKPLGNEGANYKSN